MKKGFLRGLLLSTLLIFLEYIFTINKMFSDNITQTIRLKSGLEIQHIVTENRIESSITFSYQLLIFIAIICLLNIIVVKVKKN